MEQPRETRTRFLWYPTLVFGTLLTAFAIGFRYRVGGDWLNYYAIFRRSSYQDFFESLARSDPGYELLNWFANVIETDIWFVNLVCGLLFAWGLLKFAAVQRNPWLAVVVAVPYLIVVVAMGYTRQAVAIGILMAGIASRIQGGSMIKLAVYVFVAALFHKTAVVVYPLVALASQRNRVVNVISAAAIAVLLYDIFLAPEVDRLVRGYTDYDSEGAAIRVAMSALPAALFLLWQKRFGFSEPERLIWRNFSIAALGLLVLLFVLPSTTAVDRIALYIIPLQLAVLSRIPATIVSWNLGKLLVIGYSCAVQFTWLNYATHAQWWVPYRMFPF